MTQLVESYGVRPPRYRLPSSIRLGPVTLQVSDVERSIAYYTRVLGMQTLERSDASATLGTHGDDRPLVRLVERAGARPVPRRGRLGLYHFAILLPDRAALGSFVAHLADVGESAGMSDHLVSEAVYLTDPDGLGIEVYADRPREEWRVSGGQLVMATEPLDVHAVVQAARGERWSGMPAGTVMGHVHLFVADLAAAATFYHEGVGFDKTVWSYPGALFMSAGGYHHHLGTNSWAAGAPLAEADDARLLEWELIVATPDDARAAVESVAALGAPTELARDGGVVRDPWGTALRIRARL
jgi:catechol 2,3-dioxygenase